jgi:protein phosphatase
MSESDKINRSVTLTWCGLTDVGRFRKNNEDAFLALTFNSEEVRYLGKIGDARLGGSDYIFAVSDGMGGENAGEFASKIAVDKIAELLPKSFNLGAMGLDRGCSQILAELVNRINTQMMEMGSHYEECRGMGATLSLCWFTPGRMYFAHVGDSRIYYFPRKGEMQQITEDHTHVARLVKKRRISAFEARSRPDRNVLEQALGGNVKRIDPQIGSVEYEVGDRFILCTDGVSDGISNRRIQALTEYPPANFADLNYAERLVVDAKQESGRDNLTALAVEIG